MTHLLSDLIWYYLIFLATIGALCLLLGALALRDYWKCRRYRLEQEHSNDNPNNDVTI